MVSLTLKTWEEINKGMALRIVNIRKRRRISQQKLSELSGVSFGSIKRFEQSGEISLKSLTMIAIALGIASELDLLFSATPYKSIQEVIDEQRK